MGYFANGSAGDAYEEKYCSHCIHQSGVGGEGCIVMLAHIRFNYKERTLERNILDMLIPRNKEGGNEVCKMFYDATVPYQPPNM